MRTTKITMILMALLMIVLVGCGKDVERVEGTAGVSCYSEQVTGGINIICGDDVKFLPNGSDGSDASAILTSVDVAPDQCVEVFPGVYAENIRDGKLADIYLNGTCADRDGEFCDNLIPSFGISGRLDDKDHEGSGTTCWAGDLLITAHKELESSTTLTIKVINFQ